MQRNVNYFLSYLAVIFLFSACKNLQLIKAEYIDYKISSTQNKDSGLLELMQPYKDSVTKTMQEVVGYAEQSLQKKQPEGTLGNFVVDAMFFTAKKKFNIPIDATFANPGGIRIDEMPAGNITKWDVFSMMPFENLLVIQKIKGDVLLQYLDLMARNKGWPVAGMTMQIKDRKAVNIYINGKPLHPDTSYTILHSDYLANGGENAVMLKTIPQQNLGYLVRDAIFYYIEALKKDGKNISATIENRVTYVE